MPQRTSLYDQHIQSGAVLVDFCGWELPMHYGSQLQEHHAVRQQAGMFDVSHMTVIDIHGIGVKDFLRYLLANDVARLSLSKALYSCMLNPQGGILDDLIVYYLAEETYHYRVVVNAATREKDLAWIIQQASSFSVTVTHCDDVAMIAVQGPEAIDKLTSILPNVLANKITGLSRFQACQQNGWFVARTGYTGEDGVEIILPSSDASSLWQQLLEVGVVPCGLGARDTLRLEAGMHLYGTDMDETVTPLESGLAWTVAWDPSERDFIGKKALLSQRAAGVNQRCVGLMLTGKGVLRNHQRVVCAQDCEGEITSGSFSPSLNCAIAMARIPTSVTDPQCYVDVRGRLLPARIVKLPFVRQGASVVT